MQPVAAPRGIWQAFNTSNARIGSLYKYQHRFKSRMATKVDKVDPFGFQACTRRREKNRSSVRSTIEWQDRLMDGTPHERPESQ